MLEKSPFWVNRKYKQAHRELTFKQQSNILDVFRGALLTVDSLFNKGQLFNKILPQSQEQIEQEEHEIESNFVSGTWWIPEQQTSKG